MENCRNLDAYTQFETPCFIVDRVLLEKNLKILKKVRDETGAKILLAQKAYALFASYPLLAHYLDGTCASSPYEARLGKEEFKKTVHTFGTAYSQKDFEEIYKYSDHIIFNSVSQYERFYRKGQGLKKKYGLRINPEHRETVEEIYDPAAPLSRLGITIDNFPYEVPEGISGLHMHTLCQQDSSALERTFSAAEKKFGKYFHEIEWLNLGGGHHITRDDYNLCHLIYLLNEIKGKYNVEIFIEPGEAIALNAGFLTATVLDIIHNGIEIAILDTSAAAHMPDVIEMPYRPHIINSGQQDEKRFSYRVGGVSCLAGDIFGDYSFDKKLEAGDKLIFTDMAIYSMVKTNTFNGIKLPDIKYYDSEKDEVLHGREFTYEDFKGRLS
jgi:carboxynorspermidine decarboxylase